jgi:3-deoxy-D-manno-octulosonate 8-phosphate phosphatase (KDO 8-P phosphatase)
MPLDPALAERCKKIKLLLMDCDGVLTDGRLYFSANGEELKVFDVKDGQGLANWHRAGFVSGIISGRGSGAIIQARADELGMAYVVSSSRNKAKDFADILLKAGFEPDEVAFIGDDTGDMPVMERAGFPIAVADAVEAIKAAAAYVTKSEGGRGAVREVVDMLLESSAD